MTRVLGILEPSDDRGRRADPFGRLAPRQAGPGAELVDMSRHRGVGQRRFIGRDPRRVVADVAVEEVAERPGLVSSLSSHRRPHGRGSSTGHRAILPEFLPDFERDSN
jgi:hypothetical protein